jgi:UDP-N-acetylglucosamine diphosphorylase/glucosamine-1-phosphate N-acetyltransferase
MLAGTRVVRDRWAGVFQEELTVALCADHLAAIAPSAGEAGARPATIAAGSIIVNARCIPAAGILEGDIASRGAAAWRCAGRVAAVRTGEPLQVADFSGGTVTLDDLAPGGGEGGEIAGWWVDDPWDYIRWLPAQLEDDIMRLARGSLDGSGIFPQFEMPPESATVLGEYPVCLLAGAVVEPHVVLDATAGPILIGRHATVQSFTRLVGPCSIGEGSTIVGDRISGSSIGPVCKVRGEVSVSVFQGYSNKGHDGFVGHSLVGAWVNLGAGTTTSNLKNTYGTVTLHTPSGKRDTGMQFLGTLFGDHAKTGIGTRLTTGTIIGAGASIHGSSMPPKLVPPFAWGEGHPYGTFALDKFLEVAERAMARRSVVLTSEARRALSEAYARRWAVGP